MVFKRISPPADLTEIVECYWIAENEDPTRHDQKIIPDGFPELIFHYGDPYLICLKEWELQSRRLFAGQITSHFFLRNTGVSKVIGAKLKPTIPAHLYNLNARNFTDKVVDISQVASMATVFEGNEFPNSYQPDEVISYLNRYFQTVATNYKPAIAEKALNMIIDVHGMISVTDICSKLYVTERQLERVFKQYIGLSPKFYARIIRFNHIFEHVQKGSNTWSDVVHQAGFYDQSHFIRNFKAFTGEEPSAYLFDKNNLANFFLKKKHT